MKAEWAVHCVGGRRAEGVAQAIKIQWQFQRKRKRSVRANIANVAENMASVKSQRSAFNARDSK